jgi:hypothetical protein
MSAQIDLFVLIAIIVIVLIVLSAVYLIPVLLQLKKTTRQVDEFLGEARRDLLPMLRELREASERLNRASVHLEKGMSDAGVLLASLGEVGETVHEVSRFVHRDVGRYIGNAAGFWLGMRSASKVFLKQMKKSRRGD